MTDQTPIHYGVCIDGGVLVDDANARDWLASDPDEEGAALAVKFFAENPDLNGNALFDDPGRATTFATALKRAYGPEMLVTIVVWSVDE